MPLVTTTTKTVTTTTRVVSNTETSTATPTAPAPAPAAAPQGSVPIDRRVADLLHPGIGRHVTLIGFPYDIGCTRNGGRPGSAGGPAAFLRLLQDRRTGTAINPEFGIDLGKLDIGFYGVIDASLTLEDGHKALEAAVKEALDAGSIPFIVGGGNDQSYPNASALLSHLETTPETIGVINIDAHLDVRPRTATGLVHSGTPFRQLLEDPRFVHGASVSPLANPNFVEFAAQGNQCAHSHAEYVKACGGDIVWLRQIQATSSAATLFSETLDRMGGDKLFVSFDLDAVKSADAPGVSAPSPMGLSAQDALEICFNAGTNPRVALFDLSEMNPLVEDYRTPRLTAFMFHYFLMGVATRFGVGAI
ncbi:hypothetical protein HDU79_009574 [Rhizoclosmatium sp. JEL0117]|nr:hypothetical protein HDU79_009574 [Rhizoclosmatium sp. JEL0117]